MRAIMLTSSSNQYLRPEYLTPLPTTLDAKKSPLALLAQTCSQIGADPPSSSAKSSILNASVVVPASNHLDNSTSTPTANSSNNLGGGKSKGNHSHNHSNSSSSSSISSSSTKSHHGYEHGHGQDKSRKSTSGSPLILIRDFEKISSSSSSSNQSMNVNSVSVSTTRVLTSFSEDKSRSKTPGSKGTTPNPGNASPNNSSVSTNPANKSPSTFTSAPLSVTSSAVSTIAADSTLSSSSSTSSTTSTTSAISASKAQAQVIHLSESSSSAAKLRLSLNSNSPLNFASSNSSANPSVDLQLALKHGLAFPGLYPPAMPPSSSISAGTGIPPYLHSYARLKAAASASASSGSGSTGSDSLMTSLAGTGALPPPCRDPFCAGCQLGQHGLGLTVAGLKVPCPAGCVQCDHHKNSSSLFSGFPFLPGFSGLPPGFLGYYSGATASAGSSSIQPYVCNWIVGESYCGKRFSSSEELLQHLRSHTTSMSCFGGSEAAAAVQNLAAAAAAAGYPPPQVHHHHHPLLSSSHHHGHSLLSRTYPTPPLSPLSSARFHPYSKPGAGGHSSSLSFGGPLSLTIPPAGFPPGFSGLGHPALSPYYPYSLYGQRLGASAGSMHP